MSSSVFPWKMLAISAFLLVVLFVGGFLISGNQPVRSQQTVAKFHKVNIAAITAVKDTSISANKTPALTKTNTAIPVKNARVRFKHKLSPKKTDTAAISKSSTEAIVDDGPTPLNEMLVMSINAPTKPAVVPDAVEKGAHPKKGWDNFEKYLSTEAIAPNGKNGTVKLSFTVNADGSLADFKVQSSLSDAADKKAIELLKNGPSWAGNSNKQSSEVSVSVDFH